MLKRRIRTLAVTGITIVAAIVFTTLSATGALTASPAPAGASAAPAPGPAHAVMHVVSSGLAKDCEEIELGNTGLQLWDNGVGHQISLVKAPGSCWNLYGPVCVSGCDTSTPQYGYLYKDLRGDCLWDDGTVITTAAGSTCSTSKSYEVFYGVNYYHNGHNSPGWLFTDAYFGPSSHMATGYDAVVGSVVYMSNAGLSVNSNFWNFP